MGHPTTRVGDVTCDLLKSTASLKIGRTRQANGLRDRERARCAALQREKGADRVEGIDGGERGEERRPHRRNRWWRVERSADRTDVTGGGESEPRSADRIAGNDGSEATVRRQKTEGARRRLGSAPTEDYHGPAAQRHRRAKCSDRQLSPTERDHVTATVLRSRLFPSQSRDVASVRAAKAR